MALGLSSAVSWAKGHPVALGLGVFGLGLAALFLTGNLGGGGGGAASQAASDGASTSAYFAAESAQAQAGDQLQAVQIEAGASTAQALSSNATQLAVQQLWATSAATQDAADNAAAVQLAPYQAQATIAGDLTQLGLASPTVTTVTGGSKTSFLPGIFGPLFSSTKAPTSTTTASPALLAATQQLSGFLGSGMYAAH
jgi:hypothetical protein